MTLLAKFAELFPGLGHKDDAVTFGPDYYPDIEPNAIMYRIGARIAGGKQSDVTGNRTGPQGALVSLAADGPSYLARDATWQVGAGKGGVALFSVARSSQTAPGFATIASARYVDNDAAGMSAYADYVEVTQRAGAGGTRAREMDVRNCSGSVIAPGAYGAGSGPFGDWAVGGGDATFGQAVPNAPSGAAYYVLSNAAKWCSAFVVHANALEGCDGVTGSAAAFIAARGHSLRWDTPLGINGASIRCDVNDPAKRVTQLFFDNAFIVFGVSGKRIFDGVHTLNAVNYPGFRNSVAGQPVQIIAGGDDAHIDVQVAPKGNGKFRFGVHVPTADTPVTGYIEMKDTAGNLHRLATV